MAVAPASLRRGAIVVLRFEADKARPAVVVRADLLAALSYATVLPLTTDLRSGMDFRIDVEPSETNGLRERSQVMVDWAQTIRVEKMGAVIGQLDAATMRRVTGQMAVVLGIGSTTQ
jgi:mRNA interferase MazF